MSELISRLSAETGLGPQQLFEISATAPWRYKVFSIKKRSGDGRRIIAQPSRELKLVQRALIRSYLADLPVHEAAHGYVSGRGIRTNAEAHKNSRFLLKLDFRDFFPSIIAGDFLAHFGKYAAGKLSQSDTKRVARLIFWAPRGQYALRLCIGAPTSPLVSNTIMYGVDERIESGCVALGVKYTRYADDLTFSTNEPSVLRLIAPMVREILRGAEYPRLALNEEKTVNASRAHRRVVTGVVLSSTGELSLGYERKRLIRSMAHHFATGQLQAEGAKKLMGLLAFADDIDPSFSAKIRLKFGV